ncbi:MAG: imidazolonepropionase, partial [Myxococcales bacterium]
MLEADLVVRNARELCTLAGDRSAGADAALAAITNGALACRAGEIVWVGEDRNLEAHVALNPGTRVLDATGCTVTPGFVDCHTHLVFGGDRADEFALRCAGASYLDIAKAGGGIQSTVRATRAASEEELVALALPRLKRLLAFGITTAEAKSGYGLELPSERRMLRAIAALRSRQSVELVATLLCAHAVPAEYAGARERYVDVCVNEILPAIAEERLATFCDAFVEQGAFTVEEGRRILRRASELGLRPRLHADQM